MPLATRGLLLLLLLALCLSPVAAQETTSPPEASPEPVVESGGDETTEEPRRLKRRGEIVGILQDVHIKDDEVARAVVCIGCNAVIEGRVTHTVVVVGGTLDLTGEVGREMTTVLSDVRLGQGALVGRDFVNVLSQLEDEGAEIEGSNLNLDFPVRMLPSIETPFGVLGSIIATAKLIGLVLTLFCILILAVFVPDRIRVISNEVPVSLLRAYVYGLLGYVFLLIAAPVVYGLLCITVVGIPLIPAAQIALALIKILGLAGIFHYIGHRIGHALGRDMSLAGAILLGFLPFAMILVIPAFFGLGGLVLSLGSSVLFAFLVKVPALGLLIITRIGGRNSLPPVEAPPTAEAPPPPETTPPPVPSPGQP